MALSDEGTAHLGEGKTKEMSSPRYAIHAFWGPRRETPDELAARFDDLIDRLTAIDPVFSNWIWYEGKPTPVAFAAIRSRLAEEVAATLRPSDFGDPEPIRGYWFGILNGLVYSPSSISIDVEGGSWIIAPGYSNTASIELGGPEVAPDPAFVTYSIFKAALLALAECFDATFCNSYPATILKLWPHQKFRAGWMNYVAPRFASLITPPQSAIVEHCPNGALFMAATDETFVTSTPQHLAVARDIEAAIAPLNALPWPPDAEPA